MPQTDSLAKLMADITSWYWWVSVVVVGVGINLLSSYLKPWLDQLRLKRSEKKRRDDEAGKRAFDSEVHLLTANATLLVVEGLAEIRDRVRALLFIFLAALCAPMVTLAFRSFDSWLSVYAVLAVAIAMFTLLVLAYSMYFLETANQRKFLIETAKRKLRKDASV